VEIATVAMTPDKDPEISLSRLLGWMRRVRNDHPRVRLIHFGETILGWFHHPPDSAAYHASIAEPIPGAITEMIAAEARTLDLAVSFGMTEKTADGLYNAQVLISSDGTIAAVHRKFNLRSTAFHAGPQRVTFAEVEGLRVALLICADLRRLRAWRTLRAHGVDLLLASLADYATDVRLNQLLGCLPDAWCAVSNRFSTEAGRHWPGLITLTGPLGRLHGSAVGAESVLVKRIPVSRPCRWSRVIRRTTAAFRLLGLLCLLAASSLRRHEKP